VKENMKSTRHIVLIILFSIAGAGVALAGNPRTVVVTNNTSYTMTQFYASPSSSAASTWDTTNNLYAGQTLAPGQQTTITVDSGDDSDSDCHYDLMAILQGTTQAAYTYSVNACGGGSWSISGM
jgi:hypothetical protein